MAIGDSDTRVSRDVDEDEEVDSSDGNEESRCNLEEEKDTRDIPGHHMTDGPPRHFSSLPAIFGTFIAFLEFQSRKFHI